jgi:WD40 repeat protein
MLRATDKSVTPMGLTTKTRIEFVREFVGHNTGVTCLTRVDSKGRFLSASKDCSVILWDSRYNCDDGEALDEENRTFLARFENMDQRALKSIAMTEEGSYVRPTDNIDFAMLKAAARKTVIAGSAGLQQAAREKHIISCTCRFASITGHHNSVKIWSIQHSEDQNGIEAEENCAEVTMDQELKSNIVVKSLSAALGKGIILTGDRMGNIKLWRGGRGLLDPSWTWTCERIFSWKKKTDLCSVGDAMNFAVSSITFLSDEIFVSGYRGGTLRLWKMESDKELVSINGAHNDEIVDIQLGCFEEKNGEKRVSFASASSDGKVLYFSIAAGKSNKGKPLCYNVVSHGIACRYSANRDSVSVQALECVDILNTTTLEYRKAMISACSSGNINILKAQLAPDPQSKDALLVYRKQIEEEALTLHTIVADMLKAIEVRDRKKKVFVYKQCFLGR